MKYTSNMFGCSVREGCLQWEEQTLVFLGNVLAPFPLSSSGDGERRAFTAPEKEQPLGSLHGPSLGTLRPFYAWGQRGSRGWTAGPGHPAKSRTEPGLPEGHAFAALL